MKKILVVSMMIFILFASIGCNSKDATPSQISTPALRLGMMSDTVTIPYLIAKEEGYFTKNGVNVEIMVFKSAADRDAALQAGEIDAISSDLLAACLYKQADMGYVVTSTTYTSYLIVSSPEADIADATQLAGKSIGLSINTIMEYFLDCASDSLDLDPPVEKISIPSMMLRLEMLNTSQIDGACLPEPLATSASLDGGKAVVSTIDLDIKPGVLLFNKKYIEANLEAFDAFYAGLEMGFDYLADGNMDKYTDMFIEKLLFPANVFGVIDLRTAERPTLPRERDVENAVTWMLEKELITDGYSYDDLVYNK